MDLDVSKIKNKFIIDRMIFLTGHGCDKLK